MRRTKDLVLFRKRSKKVNKKNCIIYFLKLKYILNIGGSNWVMQICESYDPNRTWPTKKNFIT